jgi:hypothetical protein
MTTRREENTIVEISRARIRIRARMTRKPCSLQALEVSLWVLLEVR